MKVHRFYCNQHLGDRTIVLGDGDLTRQIFAVLKLKKGELICLFNGDGQDYLYCLEVVARHEAHASFVRAENNLAEISREVVLYCSILKKENFEIVAQKATEIGVKKIVPIVSDNTIKLQLNLERIRKIVLEATEQSGRNFVPKISEPINFETLAKNLAPEEVCLFCDFDGKGVNDLNLGSHGAVNIFIGPEGGWSQFERDFAKQRNFLKLSLGGSTLRAETAAIVACAFVVAKIRR